MRQAFSWFDKRIIGGVSSLLSKAQDSLSLRRFLSWVIVFNLLHETHYHIVAVGKMEPYVFFGWLGFVALLLNMTSLSELIAAKSSFTTFGAINKSTVPVVNDSKTGQNGIADGKSEPNEVLESVNVTDSETEAKP